MTTKIKSLIIGLIAIILLLVIGLVFVLKDNPSKDPTSIGDHNNVTSAQNYMDKKFQEIKAASKKSNVVVVTYDTSTPYSNTFVKMVKDAKKQHPNITTFFVQNNHNEFKKMYESKGYGSIATLITAPKTNIFTISKGDKMVNLIAQHHDDSNEDNISVQPIDDSYPITQNFDRDNRYLLKHINDDPTAKQAIQKQVIDFSYTYFQ